MGGFIQRLKIMAVTLFLTRGPHPTHLQDILFLSVLFSCRWMLVGWMDKNKRLSRERLAENLVRSRILLCRQ